MQYFAGRRGEIAAETHQLPDGELCRSRTERWVLVRIDYGGHGQRALAAVALNTYDITYLVSKHEDRN
jgi:hypothetical protein